jgi:hypothetical protein
MDFFSRLFGKKAGGSNAAQISDKSGDSSSVKISLRDTQLIEEEINPKDFPVLSDEIVTFEGNTYALCTWLEMFKDSEVFIWSLPEKDYGEPRYRLDWNIFRTPRERAKLEDEYIGLYIKYAKIILSYSRAKKLHFNQSQCLTANVACVWLNMAPKYKMIRREFSSLRKAIQSRLQVELDRIFR